MPRREQDCCCLLKLLMFVTIVVLLLVPFYSDHFDGNNKALNEGCSELSLPAAKGSKQSCITCQLKKKSLCGCNKYSPKTGIGQTETDVIGKKSAGTSGKSWLKKKLGNAFSSSGKAPPPSKAKLSASPIATPTAKPQTSEPMYCNKCKERHEKCPDKCPKLRKSTSG